MSGGVYGGDEVGALVFDPGSHTFRVGFAGEEFPKGDIPSQVGMREILDEMDDTVDQNARKTKMKEYFIGRTFVNVPRARTEIKSYMKDCMIDDWDVFEQLVDYSYSRILFSESQYQPVLFSEAAWNTKANREKLTELMFEKYNVPTFYVVKNAVLSCYANGRTAGLILDSGATQTSAVPVFDGYCITHGTLFINLMAVVKQPVGGDMIAEQCRLMLEEQKIDLVPSYKIASKEVVNEMEPPIWTEKKNLPEVTKSYETYMEKQILEDLAASVLQCCDTPIDVEFAEKLPSSPFCFPNGYSKEFQAERIKIPEGLFDTNYLKAVNASSIMSVSQIAATACGMCDIDIRPTMYSGLMVTGGNSLLMGFTERLNHDLAHKCPPTIKLRVYAAPTPMERRFGAWIGGSILASLGAFQQMWISRAEYDDEGKSIVSKKCA
ncbi:Actin-like protein 6A [Dirofilaria immitis]|nr:Actin-like protein 6A [Dirofilaria immitis]